jgi:putative redox protein
MAELRVRVGQKGRSSSEGSVREHRVTIDRPQDKGGGNEGPMGGELFAMGLGGCYMSNLLAIIRARESAIRDAAVDVIAKLDGTPPRFVEFTLEVSGNTGNKAELEELALAAERVCVVANSLKPFMPVHVRVK